MKMVRTGSPKRLWDHCFKLQALICSNTTNKIYMTARQVPETMMTVNTADISTICQFGWYDWLMFYDNIPSFPDDTARLGRYLGPTIDVGSMLTATILTETGQYVCRSTLQHMDNGDCNSAVHKDIKQKIDEAIDQKLGPPPRPLTSLKNTRPLRILITMILTP